ncbi:MAG TPA: hypothetical protein VL096_08925 [Pirellulaceae bacterium]|nr:hypothetical protein [Pirellulaceae bacterium]
MLRIDLFSIVLVQAELAQLAGGVAIEHEQLQAAIFLGQLFKQVTILFLEQRLDIGDAGGIGIGGDSQTGGGGERVAFLLWQLVFDRHAVGAIDQHVQIGLL